MTGCPDRSSEECKGAPAEPMDHKRDGFLALEEPVCHCWNERCHTQQGHLKPQEKSVSLRSSRRDKHDPCSGVCKEESVNQGQG